LPPSPGGSSGSGAAATPQRPAQADEPKHLTASTEGGSAAPHAGKKRPSTSTDRLGVANAGPPVRIVRRGLAETQRARRGPDQAHAQVEQHSQASESTTREASTRPPTSRSAVSNDERHRSPRSKLEAVRRLLGEPCEPVEPQENSDSSQGGKATADAAAPQRMPITPQRRSFTPGPSASKTRDRSIGAPHLDEPPSEGRPTLTGQGHGRGANAVDPVNRAPRQPLPAPAASTKEALGMELRGPFDTPN
jgi:hypothetical protein